MATTYFGPDDESRARDREDDEQVEATERYMEREYGDDHGWGENDDNDDSDDDDDDDE